MMHSNYYRLSLPERIDIEKSLSHKHSFSAIANALNRLKSCISREVAPYGRKKYNAITAHRFAVSKSSGKRFGQNKIVANKVIGNYVLQKLELRWSPEQIISKRMIKDFPDDLKMRISHEATGPSGLP